MGKIANQIWSSNFTELVARSGENNETNDCAVKAIALACNTPYEKVLGIVNGLGRRPRQGTSDSITYAAIRLLGYRPSTINKFSKITAYPSPHCNVLKNITTHHPSRFPATWQDGKSYLMFTSSHVAAVINGVTHDWTAGRAMRVIRLVLIEKISQEAK